MTQEQWTGVDRYLNDLLVPSDPTLEATLRASAAAGLPPINVAPNQGKLLYLLALASGARTILEIGTLGGYSTIWMARALPESGRLVTLEADPRHADVARTNIANAGLSDSRRYWSGRLPKPCRTSRASKGRPLTWYSSTRTSRAPPPTSPGRWSCHTSEA